MALDNKVVPEGRIFSPEEINLPSSAELIEIGEVFGPIDTSPEGIRGKVRELLVPMALLTYKNLLLSTDPKVKKSAADSIMEIAGLKGGKGPGNLDTGLGGIHFNLLGEERKNLLSGLSEVLRGEERKESKVEIIPATVEIMEDKDGDN